MSAASASGGAAAGAGRLVVATYNVHACVGSDGRRDPERTGAVLRELDADVIALQEVDARPEPASYDPFRQLSRACGLRVVEGPTLHAPAGRYGNALLTRLPVGRVEQLDLSVPGREPRGALDVDLRAGGATLRVLAVHLGLAWRERRLQARRLAERVAQCDHRVVVLLGDVNEWIPRGALVPLQRTLGRSRGSATFPARRPVLALDRVWVRPAAALRELRVHRSPLARVASDHLPLRAEIALGALPDEPQSNPWSTP